MTQQQTAVREEAGARNGELTAAPPKKKQGLLPSTRHFLEIFRWEKRVLARFVASSLGRTACSILVIFLIQQFLSGVLGEGTGITGLMVGYFGRTIVIAVVVCLLFLAYIGGSLLNYDNQVVQQHIIKFFELGMMDRLIRHLLKLSVSFFQTHSHGDLIQALRQDVTYLRLTIRALANIFLEGLLAIGLVLAAIWLSPWLAFWALGVFPIVSVPIILLAKRIRASSFKVRKTGYVFFDIVLQVLSGIRVIKAYRAEENEAQISIEKGNLYFDEMITMVRVRSFAQVLLESLAGLGVVLVIVVGSFPVIEGKLGWPDLLAFLMAVRALHGPLNNLYQAYTDVQTYSASVHRIAELLDTEPEIQDRPDAVPLGSAPDVITFEDVTFSYGESPILKNISFEVRAGETIGIVGPSGAGKSTLLNLIVRFYDPTAGRVLFDGCALDHFRLADVYDKVAIVTQEPFLFATTVRENIRCGRQSATHEEVETAARAAYIHDEILRLPHGYDTPIGIGGRVLSRGQCQRVNLARAFLKGAPILLLDEATSSLDSVAESEIEWALEKLMKGKTNFVVTHQFSNLRNVDRIIVLDHGRCAGIGTPDELYRDCPLYRRMLEIQRLSEAVS